MKQMKVADNQIGNAEFEGLDRMTYHRPFVRMDNLFRLVRLTVWRPKESTPSRRNVAIWRRK